jgi:hypothetical protein
MFDSLALSKLTVDSIDPEQKIPEIFLESEAYYVLGFERGTRGLPDARRRIEVKVGRKGVHVYAQRQYVVPAVANAVPSVSGSAAAPASLEAALSGLLPVGGRPLALAVAAFAGPDSGKAVVRVNVDAGGYARTADTPVPLEIAVAAMDQTGRQVALARQTSAVTFPQTTSSRPAEAVIQTQLELAQGDYEVRVAISDPAMGTVSSVYAQLAIPPFGNAPLSLSDVTIEATSVVPTPDRTPPRQPSPTTRRVFHHSDQVRARMQIYQGTQRNDFIVPVSVRARVLDAQGRAVRDQSLVVAEQAFTNRRAGCQIAIDVEHLPPGDYLLSLDASFDRQATGRALSFAVQ